MARPLRDPVPTVLITGAAAGIGHAAALRFVADGWRCVRVDHDADALARGRAGLAAARRMTDPGTGPGPGLDLDSDLDLDRVVDLTDPAAIASLADLPVVLDAVINNAGMSDASGLPLVEQDASRQARLAALNLAAPAAVVAAVGARLVPGARIVNVASGAGLRAIPFRGWYSATKAGLIAQTRALARARPDLVVTVLCPGFVRTELVDGLIAAGRLDPRQAVAKTPLGRMAEPAEMAAMLRLLAGREAGPLHGTRIALCGGSSVYGGSRACEPASARPLPANLPLALVVSGDPEAAWQSVAAAATAGPAVGDASPRRPSPLPPPPPPPQSPQSPQSYRAVLDASPLAALSDPAAGDVPGRLVAAVHEAARRFAATHPRDASLTLLLPSAPCPENQGAGAADGARAAARMLVATLACELAPRALRVNAVVVGARAAPDALAPLLRFIAGAEAQFLTGQTLWAGAPEDP